MLRAPSRKFKKKGPVRPNLVPILDAVFIFIFFLLMSANFTKVFEIKSNAPMVSEVDTQKDKKIPLALTLKINESSLAFYTGVPSKLIKRFRKQGEEFNLVEVHDFLVGLKKRYPKDKDIVFEPLTDIDYEKLIKIMDTVSILSNTDESIFVQDPDGVSTKINELFSNIIFGNIKS